MENAADLFRFVCLVPQNTSAKEENKSSVFGEGLSRGALHGEGLSRGALHVGALLRFIEII